MKNVGFNIPVVVAHRKQEILGAPDLARGNGTMSLKPATTQMTDYPPNPHGRLWNMLIGLIT